MSFLELSYLNQLLRISFLLCAFRTFLTCIEDLELFLSNKNDKTEKRAFVLLAIWEKTLQTSKSRNSELAKYLNHKSNETPLQKSKGFNHKLISSYTIAHNSSIEKKNILHQVRLFLIEILNK